MPSATLDVGPLKAVLTASKEFGIDDVWLRAGDGRVVFRGRHEGGYALVMMTIPAEGCDGVKTRALGFASGKLSDALKATKGKLTLEWKDDGGEGEKDPRSNVVEFRSGTGRRRSLPMLGKNVPEVKQFPDVAGRVTAWLDMDDLKRVLTEADKMAPKKAFVRFSNVDGRLRLFCRGDAEGDELEWDGGPCEGESGKVGWWNAELMVPILPTEYDEVPVRVRLTKDMLIVDWTVGGTKAKDGTWSGGQPCALAFASLDDSIAELK